MRRRGHKRTEFSIEDSDDIKPRLGDSAVKPHRSTHRVQGASVTMVSGTASPFHVCQDEGGKETILFSRLHMEGNGHAYMCVFVLRIPSRESGGFKTLCSDRGSSHDLNHSVTTAELEMSHLISIPQAWVLQHLWHRS